MGTRALKAEHHKITLICEEEPLAQNVAVHDKSTSSTMITVVRQSEFVPEKSFAINANSNYQYDINHQLSSPLSSYVRVQDTDNTRVVLTHEQYYPERLEVTA